MLIDLFIVTSLFRLLLGQYVGSAYLLLTAADVGINFSWILVCKMNFFILLQKRRISAHVSLLFSQAFANVFSP